MRRLVLWVLGSAIAVAGCGGEVSLRPPRVHYGQGVCAVCGMIVSDERFAAAVVSIEDGVRHEYLLDDVGELAGVRLPPGVRSESYVHDMSTLQWVVAREAVYLRSDELKTPMGMGVGAFVGLEGAQAAQEQFGGEIVAYDALFAGDP